MPKVVGYHRPRSVEEAVGLLAQPDTAVLAGGTHLNASGAGTPVVAVDVQSLGLAGVSAEPSGRLRLGAATTLQAVADDPAVPSGLRDLARREAPSTLRTLATVGGTVAGAGGSSHLLAGLLVHDALVEVASAAGRRSLALAEVLADRSALQGSLVTAVSIDPAGTFAAERTGRTPGDDPIVAAAARRAPDGSVTVALCGVGPVPVVVDDPGRLDPPGDFLGSTEYRRHLAVVLAARVRQEVSA